MFIKSYFRGIDTVTKKVCVQGNVLLTSFISFFSTETEAPKTFFAFSDYLTSSSGSSANFLIEDRRLLGKFETDL